MEIFLFRKKGLTTGWIYDEVKNLMNDLNYQFISLKELMRRMFIEEE